VKITYNYEQQTHTTANDGTLELHGATTLEEAKTLLVQNDLKTSNVFGDEYTCFIPHSVNKQPVGETESTNFCCWVTEACLEHLQKNPNCRKFHLEGDVE